MSEEFAGSRINGAFVADLTDYIKHPISTIGSSVIHIAHYATRLGTHKFSPTNSATSFETNIFSASIQADVLRLAKQPLANRLYVAKTAYFDKTEYFRQERRQICTFICKYAISYVTLYVFVGVN